MTDDPEAAFDQAKPSPFDWKAFSRNTWLIVVAGIVFPPVGMVLTWLKPGWSNRTKWIATGLFGLLLIGRMQAKPETPVGDESPSVSADAPEAESRSVAADAESPLREPAREPPIGKKAANYSQSSEKPRLDNDFMTEWPPIKTSRKQPVDMTKVFEIRVGMTPEDIEELLGEPHEIVRGLLKATPFTPRKETARWTYRGKVKDDFIMVGMTNGAVDAGGAVGWDFEKGFDDSAGEDKKRMAQHYAAFLKRGGKPPFNANNMPK